MSTQANVVIVEGQLVAELSDGNEIRGRDFRDLAVALFAAGVSGDTLTYRWRTGLRMITAGQQAAIHAEVRRLARESDGHRRHDATG